MLSIFSLPSVAERVLKQKHWLQGSELCLVPHYDVLEPEGLAEGISGGDHSATQESGVIDGALTEAGGLAASLTVAVGSGEAPGQLGTLLRAGPVETPGQAMPVDSGSVRFPEQEEPINSGTMGSPEQTGFIRQGIMGSASSGDPVESFTELPEQAGPMTTDSVGVQECEGLGEVAIGSPGQEGIRGLVGTAMESVETGLESPGSGEMQKQEDLVEMVLPAEPGAMRFLQLYYEDLLVSLEDVALFPLEGLDVTGFRVSGPQDPLNFASSLTGVQAPFLCSEPIDDPPYGPAALRSQGPLPGSPGVAAESAGQRQLSHAQHEASRQCQVPARCGGAAPSSQTGGSVPVRLWDRTSGQCYPGHRS